jgi:carbamoyltransferase
MKILGIHAGHDSSCSVVKDGRIIADVQEERLNRVKHSADVPVRALAYCLKAAGVSNINEFDGIAISGIHTSQPLRALLGLPDPKSIRGDIARLLHQVGAIGRAKIKPPLYYPNYAVTNVGKVVNVEHHLAHAASAYYTRTNAEKCLVFTMDGAGDGIATAVWQGEGNKLELLEKWSREYSLGHPYSVVTEALHWWHGDGEGKTMGLAPYGDSTKCRGILDGMFPKLEGTSFLNSNGLTGYAYWNESGTNQFHIDQAYDVEKLCTKYGRENVAAEVQRKLEEIVIEFVFNWIRKSGIQRTAYAGGIFLNVKLNQHLWNARQGRLTEQHIFPNCGDSGLAAGAALHTYYKDKPFTGFVLDNLYWGPHFSNEEIEFLLKERNLEYERTDDPSAAAAAMLAEDKIVGWFQGRMESGPRSLGNRSILMSPCKPQNKDIINARVKFREPFRPFCPSIRYQNATEYMSDTRDEYFMITSFDVRPEWASKMPAVVHADGTLRPQMVREDMNPRFYRLIEEFGRRTGVFTVLNTSLNIRGEPMINTPQEAIRCLFDTGLDALVIGNFVLRKALSFRNGTSAT